MSSKLLSDASFRDSDGYIFYENGVVYRHVSQNYSQTLQSLSESGLFATLWDSSLLVKHDLVSSDPLLLKPRQIDTISYPYEWSFGQLKDAALCTLSILKCAIQYGFTLKDATAFNIQFLEGKPIFIDTLSFEPYVEGEPWIAYKQFCQHFLAPLALMAHVDIRLSKLSEIWIDGIPLDLAASLLPSKTKFNMGLLMHLHMHGKNVKESDAKKAVAKVTKNGMLGLIESLTSTVNSLQYTPSGTTWANYYQETNYVDEAMTHKEDLVRSLLQRVNQSVLWDLGANNGRFSEIGASLGYQVVAWDFDPAAVEQHYRKLKETKTGSILPLIQDFANPSPGIGWNCRERDSFFNRGNCDCALALALIHHLAIGNNVPLIKIATFFASICNQLIIEFVPKSDSQVQKMLNNRKDIFDSYSIESFETAFTELFEIEHKESVRNSERTIYLLRNRKWNQK